MDALDQVAQVVPVKYQVAALTATAVIGWIGKILGALANGGGLRNILFTAWQGKSVPKVIAQDYKEELHPATPATPPPAL